METEDPVADVAKFPGVDGTLVGGIEGFPLDTSHTQQDGAKKFSLEID